MMPCCCCLIGPKKTSEIWQSDRFCSVHQLCSCPFVNSLHSGWAWKCTLASAKWKPSAVSRKALKLGLFCNLWNDRIKFPLRQWFQKHFAISLVWTALYQRTRCLPRYQISCFDLSFAFKTDGCRWGCLLVQMIYLPMKHRCMDCKESSRRDRGSFCRSAPCQMTDKADSST